MLNNKIYTTFDRKLLRLSAVVLVLGELLFAVAGYFHPSQEPSNNHIAVFAEYAEPGNAPPARMVRAGRWKYNYYHGMRPEMFDLQDDPCETRDLWDDPGCVDIRSRLHALVLLEWNPERVASRLRARAKEIPLIRSWVRRAAPVEPDPVWFDKSPENRVDPQRHPDMPTTARKQPR